MRKATRRYVRLFRFGAKTWATQVAARPTHIAIAISAAINMSFLLSLAPQGRSSDLPPLPEPVQVTLISEGSVTEGRAENSGPATSKQQKPESSGDELLRGPSAGSRRAPQVAVPRTGAQGSPSIVSLPVPCIVLAVSQEERAACGANRGLDLHASGEEVGSVPVFGRERTDRTEERLRDRMIEELAAPYRDHIAARIAAENFRNGWTTSTTGPAGEGAVGAGSVAPTLDFRSDAAKRLDALDYLDN